MSAFRSLFTGSSGLQAHGDALGIVGDNIANVSTTGFKASRAGFADLLGGYAANGQRVGQGVQMAGPEALFGQGGLMQTGRGLDLSLEGNGFFIVNGNHRGAEGSYYTRDGRFGFDDEGFLVNTGGLRLQGYSIDPQTGVASSALSDLQLNPNSPPRATETVDMAVNLDASAPVLAPFDPTDPSGTSNFSTSVTVYDSLGRPHRADAYYRHQGGGTWEWHVMVDGAEVTAGTPGTPSEIASGTLSFDTDGALTNETTTSSSADFVGATAGQVITFDFGTSIAEGGTGLAGTTQFGSPSNVISLAQDGFAAGSLTDVRVGQDGVVSAIYSNGQQRALAQIGVASFAAESGLVRAGGQLFSASPASGEARVGTAASGGRGSIAAGFLEGSNVDIGNELVTMIAYQRAFQANARTVSTADEMLAEIANLKR